MNPHRGGGIGQATVGESVGCEQEAEIVRDERKGNGAPGKNRQAKSQTGKTNHQYGDRFPLRHMTKRSLDTRKPGSTEARPRKDQSQNDGGKPALKQCQCDSLLGGSGT